MARHRHYRCEDCKHQWWEEYKMGHDVFCPACSVHKGFYAQSAMKTDNVLSIKAQAIESTMNMLVNDYGIPGSQINDNMREGDTAVKGSGLPAVEANLPPPPPDLYMNRGGGNVGDFLAAGRQAGKIGDGSVTGMDIIENHKDAFNPIKNSTFETTSTKEYLP